MRHDIWVDHSYHTCSYYPGELKWKGISPSGPRRWDLVKVVTTHARPTTHVRVSLDPTLLGGWESPLPALTGLTGFDSRTVALTNT